MSIVRRETRKNKVGHFLSLQIVENRLYYKHQTNKGENMNRTELQEMLGNKDHVRFTQVTWNNVPYYIRENNTIFKLHSFFNSTGRIWLNSQSQSFRDNEYKVYIPVATKETDGDKEILVGYIWERANMGNFLLDLQDSTRTTHYPNLIWCDVGNHPYPKEVRCSESWNENQFNKLAKKLIYPHYDIAKAVRFPSQLGLSPTPP